MIDASDVSILWTWTPHHGPAQRQFEALTAATHSDCAIVLVGPTSAEPLLSRLPRYFSRQSVVPVDGGSLATAINTAMPRVSSSVVVIASSDAAPDPGWLDVMINRMGRDARIDAVTPRLVFDDDRLCAAGSVLWRDGTPEPYGGGEPASWQEHMFRRDVAAAPPACLLLRTDALRACGGFDESYDSDLYAATELCLRLRQGGGRVVYEPGARIRVSSPSTRPPASPVESAGDRERLAGRWTTDLEHFPSRPVTPTTRLRLAARDAICVDRLLIVDDRVPGADRGSGDPRMLRLVMEVAALWPSLRITFVALRPIEPQRYAEPLLEAGIEVLYGCPDWEAWFNVRRFHYGIVMVSRPQPIDPILRRTQPQAFRIYDAEALVFRRLERMLPFVQGRGQAREVESQLRGVRTIESEYLSGSDLILCVSHEERRAARAIAERVPAFVVPHQADVVEEPQGFRARSGLLYFGGFMAGAGSPNEDALLHLVHDILPLLHLKEPHLLLYIVGADVTPAIRQLESDRIRVIGYVPDPASWFSRVRVHAAPMRFGSGVKLKLIDTMAAGLPFVTTRIGAEGLRLGSLSRTIVAETPEDLAERILALYSNETLWTATQASLLRLARQRFSRERFRAALGAAMTCAGLRTGNGQNERQDAVEARS